MTTLTFGSGGDYSSAGEAYAAADFSTDILILEVGDSTHTTISQRDQLGATAIVRGEGYTVTSSVPFFDSDIEASGDIIIEFLDIRCASNGITFARTHFGVVGEGDITFRYNTIQEGLTGIYWGIVMYHEGNNDGTLKFYGNHCECKNSYGLYLRDHVMPVIAEDNLFIGSLGVAGTLYSNKPALATMRRNYFKTTASTVFGGTASDITGVLTETFTDINETALGADYKLIEFDSTEFYSTVRGNNYYGVPLPGSTLTTAASQSSGITNNIIGLNDIAVGVRAAGCYTPPGFIVAPTDVTVEYVSEGAKVTWTPVTQIGYARTQVFWEIVDIDSAFITPKKVVSAGTNTYTIPYSDLLDSPIWYLKLSHGA